MPSSEDLVIEIGRGKLVGVMNSLLCGIIFKCVLQ